MWRCTVVCVSLASFDAHAFVASSSDASAACSSRFSSAIGTRSCTNRASLRRIAAASPSSAGPSSRPVAASASSSAARRESATSASTCSTDCTSDARIASARASAIFTSAVAAPAFTPASPASIAGPSCFRAPSGSFDATCRSASSRAAESAPAAAATCLGSISSTRRK